HLVLALCAAESFFEHRLAPDAFVRVLECRARGVA
ncbi:MAG: hypothetical protein ACI8TX_002368, partial [Hyphomicrobiaceae bacterium]